VRTGLAPSDQLWFVAPTWSPDEKWLILPVAADDRGRPTGLERFDVSGASRPTVVSLGGMITSNATWQRLP
jgi:hypothetical protein